MLDKIKNIIKQQKSEAEQVTEQPKRFVPNQRVGKEDMTDEQILKQGFNGSTYSINGRDVDF